MKKGLLLCLTFGVILGMYLISPYSQKESVPTVQMIQPQMTAIQDTVTLYGNIVDPNRKKLYPNGNSRVLEVYVREGESVSQGQLLMQLEKSETALNHQVAAVSALIKLKDTLETGAFEEAESMLEDMLLTGNSTDYERTESKAYNLYSPCDGMVMSLSATKDEEISSLLPCIEITQPETLQIAVSAGEEVIGLLAQKMPCFIQVPAFELEEIPGEITRIEPFARQTGALTGNASTETTVYISPKSEQAKLRPGYRVSAKISVSFREKALLLPYEAILQTDAGEEYVLKMKDGKLVKEFILTGSELSDSVEVCSGITKNEYIVLNPQTIWEGEGIRLAKP